MKILVADDEENIRNFLRSLLTSRGHAVVFANCGNTALRAISTEKPDLVFLDYQMPNTNGVEVIEELTKIKKRIMIVIMSGYDVSDLESEFEKHRNVCGFLPKPFELEDLQMCLDDVQQAYERVNY